MQPPHTFGELFEAMFEFQQTMNKAKRLSYIPGLRALIARRAVAKVRARLPRLNVDWGSASNL